MRYFLIGYMGCGKSFWAKSLAEALEYPLVDMDTEIEHREKLSIKEIFSQKGEEYFRNIERKVLEELIEEYPNLVVATGGGLPCHKDNMDVMNKSGSTVYLNASVDTLVKRLLKEKSKRPLLSGMSDDALKSFVEQHLNQRELFYEQSSIKINVDEINENDFTEILSKHV